MAVADPAVTVAMTSTVPTTWSGVVTSMVVLVLASIDVTSVPPMVTEVAPLKLVPVMVTLWPPAAGPLLGVMPLIAGAVPDAAVSNTSSGGLAPSLELYRALFGMALLIPKL